jgi:hypothetical protein
MTPIKQLVHRAVPPPEVENHERMADARFGGDQRTVSPPMPSRHAHRTRPAGPLAPLVFGIRRARNSTPCGLLTIW